MHTICTRHAGMQHQSYQTYIRADNLQSLVKILSIYSWSHNEDLCYHTAEYTNYVMQKTRVGVLVRGLIVIRVSGFFFPLCVRLCAARQWFEIFQALLYHLDIMLLQINNVFLFEKVQIIKEAIIVSFSASMNYCRTCMSFLTKIIPVYGLI